MKNTLVKGAIIPFIAVAAISVSCMSEKDYEKKTTPPVSKGVTSYASYDIDWGEAADSVSTAFIDRFYCSTNGQRNYGVFTYKDHGGTDGSNFNCYWQQAHAMAAMVDYYNRIKASDPAEETRIKEYFELWYNRKGNNYEGNASYRGSTGFGNDFTDDTCWIIITLLQMHEATGIQKYFDAAKTTWNECVVPRFDVTESGWLPWKWTSLGPNECTNGPGAIIAAMLAGYAKEAGDTDAFETYLDQAYTCFDQNLAVMAADGTLGSTPLSYTQGTCMEAGRLIWKLTGDAGYLRKAILAARGQMASSRMNEVYNKETVMRDEGTDENNSIFHAVLMHWAARMVLDKQIDSFDSKIRKELYVYILRHASYYWTLGIDKSEHGWPNSYFGVKCHKAREAGTGGSLGAYSSAAQTIESMYMVKDLKF